MFLCCTALQTIKVPDGVEHISTKAFCGCTSLREVTLPDSVTFIHHGAFHDCTSLKSLTFPPGVTIIEERSVGFQNRFTDGEHIEGFVLRGKAGSAAEVYAKHSGIPFETV